nr:efflux RND transporter permease subunit [Parachlamydiaceae bacterium]
NLTRTERVSAQTSEMAQKNTAVDKFIELAGFSFIDSLNRTNQGTNFVVLKDWDLRRNSEEQANAVIAELSKEYSQIPDAMVLMFNPPAIQGLGTVGGFEFWIENRGQGDYAHLENITRQFIAKAKERPELSSLISTIDANAEQVFIDLDRSKARSLDVPINQIYSTLQSLFASYYVNNFNKFGRVYRVIIMADPKWRLTPSDIEQIYVKSTKGKMIPLSALITLKNAAGPNLVSRFNTFAAAKINGSAAPGYSSGEAMTAMREVAKEMLPDDMSFDWGGESYQENATSGSSSYMMIAGLLMVFLILAALYEKWSLPLAIVLAVPFGIFGALMSVWMMGMNNDVYFQIGLITLIALSAKNAILIVEFAVIKHQEGMSFLEAAIEAGKLRFRAILMTSLTFIFGVIPLVLSTGAGANSRHSVGTGVLGGMIAATFLAIFFVPLFYRIISELTQSKKENKNSSSPLEKGNNDV